MRKLVAAFSGLLAVVFIQTAFAQDSTTYLVPPQPVDIGSPIFPESANAKGDEAWIELSFTVKSDGSTADFVMSDGFGSDAFKNATIDAARRWKFKPGTENGKPADWSNYTFNIPFVYLSAEGGAYAAFSKRYEKIAGLLQQKQYADARAEIQSAFDSGAVRLLYEYAIVETLLSSAENGLGHPQAAYKAIRSATPVMHIARQEQQPELGSRIDKKVQLSSKGILPDDTMKIALRQRFIAEGKLGLYIDALDTYKRLASLGEIAPTDPIAGQVKLIQDALASDQPLGIAARIENGTWLNRPARRTFSITDLKGTIENIRVSCNRRGAVLPFQPDVDWKLPAAWGDCDLSVSGSEGTQFVFVLTGERTTERAVTQTPLTVTARSDRVEIPQPPLPPPSSSPF